MSTPKTITYTLRLATLVAFFCYCSFKISSNTSGNTTRQQPTIRYSLADVDTGKALAMQYCRSCHQLPDPSLVNKATWQYSVLPAMGQYYGINPGLSRFAARRDRDRAAPATPGIDPVKWRQINAYYINNAPEHMPLAERVEPIHQLPFFTALTTPAVWYSTRAFTSLVKIDTSVKPHRIFVNDGLNNKLAVLNDKLQTLDTVNLNSTLVSLLFKPGKIYATNIGYSLAPNDFKEGNISEVAIRRNGTYSQKTTPFFNNLGRPLSMDIVDLNQDGKPDYLITQFGKSSGRLSWFEKVGAVNKEHILRDKPGSLKAMVTYSKMKRPDVWALFAQGDEGIFLYENQGKGVFKEKRVLSFPPSYGSITFDLVDFNNDGFKDIVYVCGDNGDYSQILKPYHGVYIYLNDSQNNFTQKFFYPIHGCNKAIVKDFDGDGKPDIAAISEYPSPQTPWEVFVYLENKGNLNFQAYTLPPDVPFTRGMTMDAGDIDGDGRPDLLLGAGFAAADANGTDKQPLFIVLKNKAISKQ